MAHELTHIVQQSPEAAPTVQRQLDPANPVVWSRVFESEHIRQKYRSLFEGTLAAAPGAAMQLEKILSKGTDVPHNDKWRKQYGDLFKLHVEQLVRLNALGLMASHRSSIESRRDELLHPERLPKEAEVTKVSRAEAMRSVRKAALSLLSLNQVKEELESSRSDLRGVASGAIQGCWVLDLCIDGWSETIYNSTRSYETPEIRDYLHERAETLRRGIPQNLGRAFFAVMGDYLANWRAKQISGIIASIGELYSQFPMFKTFDAVDLLTRPEFATEVGLSRGLTRAYDELLNNVDEVIVKIGRGSIHPFDLPEAVRLTRESLPGNLQAEFNRVLKDHKTWEFWKTMGLTIAQVAAVFIPVVGPAIALGIGITTTALDIDALIDRIQLARAATTPEGEILGTTGPSAFDYAMAAIEVFLTAADIKALASELRGAKPAHGPHEPQRQPGEPAAVRTGAEAEPRGAGSAAERPREETGRGSPLEKQVHERARRTGAELNAAGETHGVSVTGTGEARSFTFCSDHCADLLTKLDGLLDVLPPNYPVLDAFTDLQARVRNATNKLRRGKLTPEQADDLARGFASDLKRQANHDPRIAELLNMSPEELATRALEIKPRLQKGAEEYYGILGEWAEAQLPGSSQAMHPGEPGGSARSPLERNVMDELGISDIGEARRTPGGQPQPERFEVGNFGHDYAEGLGLPLPPGLDTEFRIVLEGGVVRRADRVQFNRDPAGRVIGGHVYEIKPDTPYWRGVGERQARLYAHYLSEEFGVQFTHSCVTYNRNHVRALMKRWGVLP